MRIAAVDFPEPLLAAQRSGKLVVFAGAGVSVAPPSNYPDLNGLARRVAAGSTIAPEPGEPIDRFLGRLKHEGVPVHQRVRESLCSGDSRPSRLHFDLLGLFPSAAEVRLVTTNFDAHFSRAAGEIFREAVEIYYAPALPLGSRLSGIVYLHGNVEKDPERIVLTDDDFGRAYLTEGWATRFLQSVFANYTVLFVGYSHNDPVMNYLSRGLPPEVRDLQKGRAVWRFALTPEDNPGRWEFLDITPIPYPLVEEANRHAALGEAIAAWVKLSRMGRREHERRIRAVVAKGLPPQGEDADYLAGAVRDPATAGLFTRYARGPEWLRWADERGCFRPLFQPGEAGPLGLEMADWLARGFAIRRPDEVLTLILRHGWSLNPALWEAIARRLLAEAGSPRGSRAKARWVPILLRSAQSPSQTGLLGHLLESCRHPRDDAAALLLLEWLTRPRLELAAGRDGSGAGGGGADGAFGESERGDGGEGGARGGVPETDGGGGGGVRVGVVLEGDAGQLWRAWEGLFRPHLASFAPGLESILAGQLQRAHLLKLLVAGGGGSGMEGEPGRRVLPAGEGRGNRWGVDFLAEAAGELLRWMVEGRPDRARAVVQLWAESGVPVLERLAREVDSSRARAAG